MKRIARLFQPPWLFLWTPFVALFPCLFLGQGFFDDDLINVHSVFMTYLKNYLLLGQLPFWNPFIFAGQPFMADPLTLSFYPFMYPALLLPIPLGLSALLAFHLFIAGQGMYLWLGKLNLSPPARIWGGLTFAFSGFFWCEVIHPNVVATFAWLPWVLCYLEKTIQEPKPGNGFVLGLLSAVFCTTLYPQMHLGAAYFCLIYFFFSLLNTQHSKEKFAGFLRCFPIILWGFFPLILAVMPFMEFMRFSDRFKGLGYETFNAGLSLIPRSLAQFLFPIQAGHPGPANSGIPPDYWGNEGYLGIWGLFFISLSFSKTQKRLKAGLALAASLFLLLALGKFFPLHRWACQWIFGMDLLRGPFRFVFVFVTAATVLGAFGFENFWNNPSSRKGRLAGGMVFYGILLLIVNLVFPCSPDGIQPWFFLLGGLALALGLMNEGNKKLAQSLFLISLFVGMVANGWSHASSRLGPNSNLDLDKSRAFCGAIKGQTWPNRVFLGDNIPYPAETEGKKFALEFPPNACCLFSIKNVGGNDSMSLSQRGDLHTLPFATFLKLMAIQGFATGNEKGNVPGFTRMERDGVKFYKAAHEVDWVYAPTRTSFIPDSEQRLREMRSPAFDPYQEAVLTQLPSEPDPNPGHQKTSIHYDWKESGINQEIFSVSLNRPSWVVFADPNYPGWHAWVDQNPTPITTSNHLFRGLAIPAGEHQVRFSYQPTWFRLGAFGVLIWLMICMAFWPNEKRFKTRSSVYSVTI